MLNLFKKKKDYTVDLIDFSMQHVGTGQIGAYIINYLYKELNFSHIGYRIGKNKWGELRCTLYTEEDRNLIISYFKDRCSGMIEDKVQTFEGIPHDKKILSDGFEEVVPYTK